MTFATTDLYTNKCFTLPLISTTESPISIYMYTLESDAWESRDLRGRSGQIGGTVRSVRSVFSTRSMLTVEYSMCRGYSRGWNRSLNNQSRTPGTIYRLPRIFYSDSIHADLAVQPARLGSRDVITGVLVYNSHLHGFTFHYV